MSDKLDLSLPEKKSKNNSMSSAFIIILLIAIFIVAIFNFLLFFQKTANERKTGQKLSASTQQDMAYKMQKYGLPVQAVAAWKEYLAIANIKNNERSNIWYNIGKLNQEAGDYGEALESYYRAETIYKNKELEQEISRRVQECLEALGKFAALRQELTTRVGMDKENKDSAVVAEIGPEKITMAELDNKIEEQINFQISQFSAFMDQDTLNKQKEELFKQYSGKDGRLQMLNQYIIEEILYRKARELKVADLEHVRALLRNLEKKTIVQSYLNQETASKINITETDLNSFYEAHKGDYIEDGKQKSLAEVKNEVYRALFTQKQREVQQVLIDGLRNEYNVAVHPANFSDNIADQAEKQK